MVSVSPDPNYDPLNNRPPVSEGVSANNLSLPEVDLEAEPLNNRLSDLYDSVFRDLYEFVISDIDKKEASDKLDELVNDGALDPADAAALNGLLSSPPNSVEDLIVRLPKLDPEQITKITDTLASDQVFKFFHKEAGLGEMAGQGKIAEIIVHNDARAPGLELKETTIAILDESENILTGDIENLILTQTENGANIIQSRNSRLNGKISHNQVEIQAEEFEYSNPPAADDLPSNTHNVSARNFSASGTHEETGAEWNMSTTEIQAEIDPDEQTGTAHNVNFELNKAEHSLTGLASDLGLAAADNSRVDLPAKADNTPALTIAYQNNHNTGLDTLMTIESGYLQSAGPILPGNNELPFQRFPTEFYFQNVELRTDWAWASLSELSGRIENNAQDDQEFTVRGALAGGQYDKFKWTTSLESGYGQKSSGLWNGLAQNISAAGAYAKHNVSLSAAEVSYAENSAINIAKLAVSYGENIHANLDAFNFQRTLESLSVSMQNLGLRAYDIGFSLGRNDVIYNSQTNDWQTSASGLAARYGDYGFYLSSFSAKYNNTARKIEFAAENVRGVIDLAKPLPILSQDDITAPETWQDYLQVLTENNITYAGSVDDLGGFLLQNVYVEHLPHRQALAAVIPYLHKVAFRFDNELVAYFEEDDFDADLLVWVNEYTDGYFGRQFNQFADAYFDFGQNIYRKQHGLDFWPDRYHQEFDLGNISSDGEQDTLSLAMAIDPQRGYISAALDYSTPWFGASYGYTYKPVDAAPDLSVLGLNYSAEHVLNSRLSLGHQLLRLNVDITWAVGKWSLGGESSNSLYGLMDAYDLTSLLPDDDDKWFVPLLLQLPVLPFVGASLSSRIPLPADSHMGFDVAWRPQLENYGHEHSFLESISWDNFLATFYLDRKVAKGLSLRLEVFTRINHLFSLQPQTPIEMSVSKVNALVGINL